MVESAGNVLFDQRRGGQGRPGAGGPGAPPGQLTRAWRRQPGNRPLPQLFTTANNCLPPSQALLSCEALLHPRSLPPPGPARRVLPPSAADGECEEGGAPLGMPRFWSAVDAALLLAQEQARLAAQQQQGEQAAEPAPQHADGAHAGDVAVVTPGSAGGIDEEMAEAGEAAQQNGQEPQPDGAALAAALPAAAPAADGAAPALPAQAPAARPALQQKAPASGIAAMLSAPPAAAAGPAATAAALPAVPAAAAVPAPAVAALPAPKAPFAPAPALPAAGGSAAAAAAAAEESDSEGSLPEIDSGEGSSSDEESDGEVASQ